MPEAATGDAGQYAKAQSLLADLQNYLMMVWKDGKLFLRKHITTKRISKEGIAMKDWYVKLYKKSTVKNMQWQYRQLEKQAKEAYKFCTNHRKNVGVLVTLAVLTTILFLTVLTRMMTSVVNRVLPPGGSADEKIGLLIYFGANAVVGVLVGIVALPGLIKS